MNFFFNNLAAKDIILTLKNYYIWVYLSSFDLRLKYRRTFLGPWWVVLGIAISATAMCFLWSTIFNLNWKEYLVYLFSGFIIWMWISQQVIDAADVFSGVTANYIKAYANPPIFYVFRKCFLSFLLFLHHIPLIILVTIGVNKSLPLDIIYLLPGSLFIVFINSILFTANIGMLSARYRDIDPLIKSLMPPMLLLTPVLWKPEMLGEYSSYIYLNPFTYFVGIIRNGMIGLDFDKILWIGSGVITFLQFIIFFILYTRKRDRIIFWV
tara:strand:+ start:1099 stop:1899 length:801 start_codon:yes stop_codon:yes gene_type:complete